jgi:hypothetical protein
MDVMRKNLLFLLTVCAFLAIPVRAAMTVEETTDAEYLINSGYSQVMAEDVFMSKNRANGKTIEPLYEKSQNKLITGLKKLYSDLDPSVEEADRIHHDIKLSPSITDL